MRTFRFIEVQGFEGRFGEDAPGAKVETIEAPDFATAQHLVAELSHRRGIVTKMLDPEAN
jgi:hypothetical protein